MRARTIALLSHGRDNNFNLIRMIAAYCVLVSHAFTLAERGHEEPLVASTGLTLGSLSVAAFFTISGFFITKSFVRRTSLWRFTRARIARIFPALIVVTLGSAFVLGPLVTIMPLSDYLGSREAWAYVFHNLTLYDMRWYLPGVFGTNPLPGVVNGSTWTLAAEIGCYAMLAVTLGLVGRYRFAVGLVTAIILTFYLLVPVIPNAGNQGYQLSFPFFLGAAAFLYADVLPLRWPVAAGLAVVTGAVWHTPYATTALLLTIGYGTLCLGAADVPLLRRYNLLGDYSYGTYIVAFPIQQTFVLLVGPTSPWTMIGAVTPIVIGLAVASWVFVEKRFVERLAPSRPEAPVVREPSAEPA